MFYEPKEGDNADEVKQQMKDNFDSFAKSYTKSIRPLNTPTMQTQEAAALSIDNENIFDFIIDDPERLFAKQPYMVNTF